VSKGWQSEPGIFDFSVSTVGSQNRVYLIFLVSTVGSQNRVYLIFVTLCEPNMLKASVQVLTPDDWLADEKYVNFQEDALSSSQFQIIDIKILASSAANFFCVLVSQSRASDKETHLSIQIPAVLEGILSFLTLLKLFMKLAFVLGFVTT
jgi:hypothetical protein